MTDRYDDVEAKSDDIGVSEGERNWASNNVDRQCDDVKEKMTILVFQMARKTGPATGDKQGAVHYHRPCRPRQRYRRIRTPSRYGDYQK